MIVTGDLGIVFRSHRSPLEAVVWQSAFFAREARGGNETRGHGVVIPAGLRQLRIDRPVIANDARHEHLAHPLADERSHAYEQMALVSVAYERDAAEARH